MMFPKSKPRDPAFMRQFRKDHDCCEICGSIHNLEIAHIIPKGAGGPDMPENVLMLDGPAALQKGCHGKNHLGLLTQEQMFEYAGRRLGISGEECRRRVRRKMGYDV